jgi:hypothetical protein
LLAVVISEAQQQQLQLVQQQQQQQQQIPQQPPPPLSGVVPGSFPSPVGAPAVYADALVPEIGTPTMASMGWITAPWSPRTTAFVPPPMTGAEAYTAQLTGALSPKGLNTPVSSLGAEAVSAELALRTQANIDAKRRDPLVEPTS